MKIQIEMWPIEKIKPYPDNAKLHTEEQIKDLAKVIETQGWDVPIVVDKKGVIIKGHGRRLAAILLGYDKVPVICRKDMTPTQAKAARLSDNRVALGEYDTDLLEAELKMLSETEFDMTGLGFSEKELDFLIDDITKMDDGAFGDEKPEELADLDEKDLAIAAAFGVKTIPSKYKKQVARFMAMVEEDTDKSDGEALGIWITTLLEASE